MSQLTDIRFTPAEFARLARINKSFISGLEANGILETIKVKVGNVDRKMIPFEAVQSYFQNIRSFDVEALKVDLEKKKLDLESEISAQAPSSEENTESLPEQTGAISAGPQTPVEVLNLDDRKREIYEMEAAVAAATAFKGTAPKHKTQMFYNVKGGTGKSTLTAQYVMRAVMMGYRVLAIDLDGQGHLTINLDVLDAHERPTVYDILINDLPIDRAIMGVAPGLDLVPANLGLCNIEIPLNQKPRREYRLAEAIEQIKDQYDLIVADTNPAASILNCSMLVAADLVNVVCATNPLSFHGMSLVMSTIEEMKREFRRELNVRIIPNMYDSREVISQEVLGELRSQFPEFCAHSIVNRCADLNEATKRRTTVWDINTKGTAAEDISSLTEELLSL